MAYEGMLANAAVTAFASACFLYVSFVIRRRRVPVEPRALAAALLFGIIGVHLTLAASRQLVAYGAGGSPAFARLEAPIFYATVLPAALAIVPLSYIAAWALSGREAAARATAGAFIGVIAVGIALVFQGGIEGPDRSYWASEWTIRSLAARVMILVFITLPAFGAGAILLRAGRTGGEAGRRARLVGWACLIYYAAFTFDALGEPGIWLLAERIAMAVAAIIGFRAYFPRRGSSASGVPDHARG